MAGPKHLLRKAALERLSSPEQLDMAMRVTSPASWVALAAFGTLIVAAVIWSVVYQIPVKVDATGILLRGETIRTVRAPASGTISEFLVQAGDLVEEDQVVARLKLPELEMQISTTRDRIRDLEAQVDTQGDRLASLQSSYETQLRDLREQLRTKQRLYEKGLARRQDVLAIQGQIASVRAQMLQSDLGQTGRANTLEEERRRLEQLEAKLEKDAVIRTPYPGRVAAVLGAPGELVDAGSRIANLEEAGEPFRIVLFVPFAEGKKVSAGMEVRISPTTVRPEEYGFIVGNVESVSSQPVTPEEVRRTLNNDQLAQRYAKDTPFKIVADPELNAANPSGFAWTSSTGPPVEVSSSTPCSSQVIVDEKRPISYIIPATKKALGIG